MAHTETLVVRVNHTCRSSRSMRYVICYWSLCISAFCAFPCTVSLRYFELLTKQLPVGWGRDWSAVERWCSSNSSSLHGMLSDLFLVWKLKSVLWFPFVSLRPSIIHCKQMVFCHASGGSMKECFCVFVSLFYRQTMFLQNTGMAPVSVVSLRVSVRCVIRHRDF